jgi:hypothetical protein
MLVVSGVVEFCNATSFSLLRRGWQRFDPREVEGVVVLAGDELDASIAGRRLS